MNDIIIGYNPTRDGTRESVRILQQDRRHHLYVIGKTGTGKTTLMENLAIQDIRNGNGVCFLDPHGQAVERILNAIPSRRINQVIYLDPTDTEYPVGLNILEAKVDYEKDRVASSVVSVFKHFYGSSWGPRLEYLLYNTVRAAMDTPGTTLVDVYRMMTSEQHRERIVRNIRNPTVRSYWEQEFTKYSRNFENEAFASVLNKVGQTLTSSCLLNIVGQAKSTIDFRHLMDTKHILLVNLSKGRIGEDRASFLGSLLITKLYLAALERALLSDNERQDFYLYVDEFQSFGTDSFRDILSEARKYRLNLTLAHQYLEQVPELIRPAVFGNMGTMVAFRVGGRDIEELKKEFGDYIVAEDLATQRNYEIIYRSLKNGAPSDPSFAKTYPPMERVGDEASREEVINASRKRFARKREDVEERIMKVFL